MQLLANCPPFPSVLLLLAKSIPVSSAPSNEALLAHCSRDFYFDATNQILYLSEAKLQHVGHFIATILQSMAHIASGNQTDSNREEPWDPILCHSFPAVVQYSITALTIIFKSTKYLIFFGNNMIFVFLYLFFQNLNPRALWKLSMRLFQL